MVPTLSPPLSQRPLTQRPPTPPRESNRKEANSSLPARGPLPQEPPSSRRVSNSHLTPNSSLGESPSTTIRKRVEFSHLTEYQDSPNVSNDGRSSLGPLPPSAQRKPIKSILKSFPSNHGEQGQYGIAGKPKLLPPHHHADFATMLESICQQLAGGDRSDRIDAYLMLSGSLKASDNIPDVDALRTKMGLLQDFIKRDQSEKTEQGKLDSNLATYALQVLASFLHKPAIAQLLTVEFTTYLVEHSIKGFGENDLLPKDVIKHLLFVLAQQTFPPKTMTQERVGRLLNSLHLLDQRVKGKSIVVGRISACRGLIRHCRNIMLLNTIWLEDLFSDMLSSIREIRSHAIAFGLEAAFSLGREDSASKAVQTLFRGELTTEGENFAEYYARRLKAMVANKEDSQQVPQIWSVIILFIRSKPKVFEKWTFTKLFLEVLQLCFNSGDIPTKLEANFAWNRFVFAISLDEKTAPSLRNMLCQALAGQLRRQRKSLACRKSTFSSIYNLLYYALSPKASSAQIDLYWDEFVVPLVGKGLGAHDSIFAQKDDAQKQDATEACNILQCLFDSITPRLWTETRAVDNLHSSTMDVKELPGLDAKWLRRNSPRVFSVLSLLIEKFYWDLGDDTTSIGRLWYSYIISIAKPAAMEVKVSTDTMSSIATIFGSLHRIWNINKAELGSLSVHVPNVTASSALFLKSFEKLVTITISGLGMLPLTEKLLSISQDTFVAVATPSQQSKKIRHQVRAPFHHLIILLTTISPGLTYDRNFSQMVHRILLPFFQARLTSKAQIKLDQDLLDLLPVTTNANDPTKLIWQVLAGFASSATDMRDDKENIGSDDRPLGLGYREVLRILEIGVKFSPHHPLPGWKTLFETLTTSAKLDAGEAGQAVAIIEPLARGFSTKAPGTENLPATSLLYYHLLISKTPYPKDRQALDAARKRLWGTGAAGPKTPAFDPYIHLYNYIRMSLNDGYASCSKQNLSLCSDIISSTTGLLDRCPLPLLMAVLIKLQESIACWIVDSEQKLVGGNTLSQAITSLWSFITTQALPELLALSTYSTILTELEPLISSGFESKHKSIVNATITFWNLTFGRSEDGFEYPEKVKETLLKLRSVADIQLPFFPKSLGAEAPVQEGQALEFIDSQDDSTHYSGVSSLGSTFTKLIAPLAPLASHLMESPRTLRIKQYTPQVVIPARQSFPRKRSRESTPGPSNRKSRKRDITPRLRHDDSQVQFEAVESSPMSDRIIDSQILTDKQKEVRERQEADAAMFPDLRSTSSSKGKSMYRSPEPELPTRRPTSNLRITSSPIESGYNTPTLVLPSDDDNFIISSPTPTRSVREPCTPDPPSSPPEVPVEATRTYDAEPLSSLEATPEPENDTTVSVDPSRQMDPHAPENTRPVSTVDTTSDHRESSQTDDPNSQLQEEERKRLSRSVEMQSDVQITRPQIPESLILDSVLDPKPPSQPRAASSSPTRNLNFVDAVASPTSSDKGTLNEDVFEDAVSSPRLNRDKAKQTSSPFSDVDESSILRLMTEFDQSSGQAGGILSSEDKENRPRLRASPRKDAGEAPASSNILATASQRRSPKQTPRIVVEIIPDDKAPTPSSGRFTGQLSSIPSLIPETPGLRMNPTSTKYIIDGEEYDPEDTIIVDASVLEDEERWPRFKRGSPRKKHAMYGKKRKHQESVAESSEVPDSQEGLQPREASPAKEPATKKRKGRAPRVRSSQAQSQSQEPNQDSANNSQRPSLSPIDLDSSIATPTVDSPAEALTTLEQTTGNGKDATPVDAVPNDVLTTPDQSHQQNAGVVADTIMDETSFFDESSFAVDTNNDPIEEIMAGASDVAAPLVPSPDEPDDAGEGDDGEEIKPEVQAEPEAESSSQTTRFSLLQSMKQKLGSLIGDLRAAVLSKPEVNELEDMFMDAKRTLYDAELRGRRSTD